MTMKLPLCAALGALALFAPTLASADSLWRLADGSILRLTDAGQSRILRYVTPSEEAAYAGEFPNATLFQGRLDGSNLTGAVITRSEVCGETTYPVIGQVEQDPLRIVLAGQSIVRNCLIPTANVRDERLVLEFVGPAD
ncbi:hypothetical protein [Gymnodinialimonas hymeniacidonis]|uniref:hypothetical protein n=1 Tax=Gymnodinialimonas hymeniacidonis TaxID=3126508 RepID=UPI0034C60630